MKLNLIFSKHSYILSIIMIIGFVSCKKSKKEEGNTCCCPEQTTPSIPPQRLFEIEGNGFFVMQKFFTINGSTATYDSCLNYAGELHRSFGELPFRYYTAFPFPGGMVIYTIVLKLTISN